MRDVYKQIYVLFSCLCCSGLKDFVLHCCSKLGEVSPGLCSQLAGSSTEAAPTLFRGEGEW